MGPPNAVIEARGEACESLPHQEILFRSLNSAEGTRGVRAPVVPPAVAEESARGERDVGVEGRAVQGVTKEVVPVEGGTAWEGKIWSVVGSSCS